MIISEPSNPWMAGMAALFTRDFFELVKKKLTKEGINAQWFHCHQVDWGIPVKTRGARRAPTGGCIRSGLLTKF